MKSTLQGGDVNRESLGNTVKEEQQVEDPFFFLSLAVEVLGSNVGGDFGFPAVTVAEKLLLIVEELFARTGSELKVGSLNDGIDRTGFLTESTVDTLGHVNIITGGAATSISAGFGLDGNGLSGADSLAQLTGDTTLLSTGVSTQSMLSTETGRQRSLLERVVECHVRLEHILKYELGTWLFVGCGNKI